MFIVWDVFRFAYPLPLKHVKCLYQRHAFFTVIYVLKFVRHRILNWPTEATSIFALTISYKAQSPFDRSRLCIFSAQVKCLPHSFFCIRGSVPYRESWVCYIERGEGEGGSLFVLRTILVYEILFLINMYTLIIKWRVCHCCSFVIILF